jgi:hypothetical protein
MSKEKTPEEEICELKEKYSTMWKVLGVFITLFSIGLGWLWTNDAQRQGQMATLTSSQTQIQIQLTQISTDVSWLKNYLQKNSSYIDSSITNNDISKK